MSDKVRPVVKFRTMEQEEPSAPVTVSVENTGTHAVHILVNGHRIALLSATGELVLETFTTDSRRARIFAELGLQVEGFKHKTIKVRT